MASERGGRDRRRLARAVSAVVLLAAAPFATGRAAAQPAPAAEVPFAPVLQGVLAGDLVMAANSNTLIAGGWRLATSARADVDGDATNLCLGRTFVPAACADNSSAATLDVPAGARIVAARLYVDTTLTQAVGPIRVRLDGPAAGYEYTDLTAATPDVPKLYEATGGGRGGPVMRQAVWDVTSYVAGSGSGTYTVADIVSERAGPWLPYASWAIVAAYELDPDAGIVLDELTAEQRERFAPRAVSWYDGFVVRSEGSVDVPIGGYQVLPGQPVFAKSFHVVAHAQARGADNLLFDGGPLGNNLTPGDTPAPAGVAIGADPACNSTTDLFNDSICVLGTPVETKLPGPTAYRASADGRTPTSGSAVDMDVTRIPGRYFAVGTTSATLSLRAIGGQPVAAGVLAVSVDLPDPASAPGPAEPAEGTRP